VLQLSCSNVESTTRAGSAVVIEYVVSGGRGYTFGERDIANGGVQGVELSGNLRQGKQSSGGEFWWR